MNKLFLSASLLLLSTSGFSQISQNKIVEYYSDAAKAKIIPELQKQILSGCVSAPSSKTTPFSEDELDTVTKHLMRNINISYNKSFGANPKLKEALNKDVSAFLKDKSCFQPGNDCKTRLGATALYHIQKLRPDSLGCEYYVPQSQKKKSYDQICELELEFRDKNLSTPEMTLETQHRAKTYAEHLEKSLNTIAHLMLLTTLHNGTHAPTELDICEPIELNLSPIYKNPFDLKLYPGQFNNIGPNGSAAKITDACVEKKLTLLSKIIPVSLEGSKRSTLGIDETLPVKALIEEYLVGNPEMVITDIEVVASSCRIPHNRKKYQEQFNDVQNLSLAQQRAGFMAKTLKELQSSRTSLAGVKVTTSSTLGGPIWEPADANLRWKSKGLTEGYEAMAEKLYAENKQLFEDDAFMRGPKDLLSYPTLLEAKYQPFQGFRVVISGYNKKESKCSGPALKKQGSPATKAKGQ